MSEDWLKTLGIEDICQWDVLVFLHRQRQALLSPDDLDTLMGYEEGAVARAMKHLESVGLVERSRESYGVRLYHLHPLSGSHRRAFEGLVATSDSRAGRLALMNKLRATAKRSPARSDRRS
jgi:DNA-binding MarR family transcriptional regulator